MNKSEAKLAETRTFKAFLNAKDEKGKAVPQKMGRDELKRKKKEFRNKFTRRQWIEFMVGYAIRRNKAAGLNWFGHPIQGVKV